MWDAAKARAARQQNGGGGPTTLLVNEGGIAGSWQSWRDNMPGEESESGSDLEEDVDGEREGSVIYRSGGGEGDSSFESEEGVGVMETPRPRSGFQ